MKAEITKKGILIIKAETELEAYALNQWFQQNDKADNEN